MVKLGVLQEVRVREVMTEGVVFLRADATLAEAWATMHRHGISGAPVLTMDGRLVGIVSRADLADPRHRSASASGRVDDAMTRVVYAVRAEDPLMSAVRMMLQENIHRAMVVNDDGSIAGIITPMDVLRALVRVDPVESSGQNVQFVDLRRLHGA
jgi:CBS domain-containing protein